MAFLTLITWHRKIWKILPLSFFFFFSISSILCLKRNSFEHTANTSPWLNIFFKNNWIQRRYLLLRIKEYASIYLIDYGNKYFILFLNSKYFYPSIFKVPLNEMRGYYVVITTIKRNWLITTARFAFSVCCDLTFSSYEFY